MCSNQVWWWNWCWSAGWGWLHAVIISNHNIIVDRLPLLEHCNCIMVVFHLLFMTISSHVLFDGTNSDITQCLLFVLFLTNLAFERGICATNLQPIFIGRILQLGLIKESSFRYFLFPKKKKYNMIWMQQNKHLKWSSLSMWSWSVQNRREYSAIPNMLGVCKACPIG